MTRQFVFVGRITREKGFDRILQSVYFLLQGGVDNFVIHVYGSGDMQEELKAHVGYGKHLIYHGRVPKEEFLEQWKTYQYTLMPSKFLETFGLVALDSLALGVPVIGIKKGGLLPFVFDDLAVDSYEMFYTTLKTTITDFDPIVRKSQSDRCLQIAADYTMQTRVDRFTGLLPFSSNQDNKSLLLVSDYAVDIGGIEHYLLRVQELLSTHGRSITLRGKIRRVTGIWRKLDLLVACCNIPFLFRLCKDLVKNPTSLVRLHSIQRRIGWVPLLAFLFSKQQPVRVMYHDVGLLHPFPSKVYTEGQLAHASSFWGYLGEGRSVLAARHRLLTPGIVIVFGKWLYSKLIRFLLRKVADLHLVPSDYLIPYLQQQMGPDHRIVTLAHFVSHARGGVNI